MNEPSGPVSNGPPARLMAIVAVAPENRILCQEPGCGHSVYAAIHVVELDGHLIAMGSSCFAKRFGSNSALGAPKYTAGGVHQRPLSEEERAMLVSNTAALLDKFAADAAQQRAEALAKLQGLRALNAGKTYTPDRAPYPTRQAPPQAPAFSGSPVRSPWPWQHERNTSVALFRGPTGQHWVRVQHKDGSQKLVPWPIFEGWEIVLPPSCGRADVDLKAYAVPDIIIAVRTLKALGFEGPLVGRWQDVRPRHLTGR
jgi:hypothetical protein